MNLKSFFFQISRLSTLLCPVVLVLLLTSSPLQASGEDTPDELFSFPWLSDREQASGSWGGVRSEMEEKGILLDLSYTGELFSNLRGGLDTSDATFTRGSVDLAVTLDTEKLALWKGGRFFILGQSQHGNSLTDKHAGDYQVLSNIDANDFTQVSELWFEQGMAGDRLRFKIGKQDSNVDFCATDFGADFINSSFGFPVNIPLTTYPDPGLGAAVFTEPLEWLHLSGGIFDGEAKGGTSGFKTTFDGRGGALSLLQADLKLFGGSGGRLPGTWRVGIWHHSAGIREITRDPAPRRYSANHGLFLIADQVLFSENAADSDFQGLGTFLQLSWAPSDRNEVSLYSGGGFSYTGLLPGRETDVTAFGMARAVFSPRIDDLDGRTHETVCELFHRLQLTPWLSLQPEVQFIFNSGGNGRNTLVAGTRFEVIF